MAQNASDSQKVDYLWKKIVYGAAKTDISGNIDATNEPNPSPLLIRGDKIIQQASLIANVIPGSNSSVVTVYPTTLPVECISTAGIPTPTLTWQTGQTFWIPPEFGSTYQIKVYISPSGQAGNVLTKGTQVFATGTTNNDLWVFDYQSGILNFNSNNTPYASGAPISFTGNSVYISGAVYSGQFGLPASTSIGNITFSNTTISTSWTSANININASGSGTVQIGGNLALGIPAGNTIARPANPIAGYIRLNTDSTSFEYYDGTQWDIPGAATITSASITPDGTANTFPLGYTATSAGVIVSINGTLQQPVTAYNISGNNIIFSEIPLPSDIIEVRKISAGVTSVTSLQYGATNSVILDGTNVNIAGTLLPSANVTYDIGSPTLRWRTGYFSANTIDLGGGTIGLHDTLGFTFTTPGGNPQYMMPNGASTSNTFISSTVTIQGNLAINGNVTTVGNVSGQYILGSAQFLTGLPIQYSNVNVAAYITSYTGNVGGTLSNASQPYITALGTISSGAWAAGTIGVAYGGTGATTATGALTSLLPGGASTGYVLTTGGSGSYYWASAGGGGGATVGQTINTLRQSNTATQGQTVFTLTGEITYTPGSGQLGVYINGVRQFPTEYTETASNVFTLTTGINAGDVVFAEINRSQSFNNYANLTYASNVGNIAASGLTVQSAIESLENNKSPLVSPVFSGVTTIGGNLVVQGNLFVNGNLTTINANNLVISDSMIYLADDNPADTLDIGFVSAFTSAVRYQHTGLVRDATDGVWKLFANVVAEPTTTIDFTNANYSSLISGNLMTTNDARIGGSTLFTNSGYKTLAVGGASGGGFLQFLTNGSAGPYIYNTSQNLVLWTDGGEPKIVLNNAATKSIEITSPNVDIVSSNVRVLGNLTVAGNVTFSGWSVKETSTKLYFAYNGVNKMSLDTGGNLVVTGDLTAFGTIT